MTEETLNRQQQLVQEYLESLLKENTDDYSVAAALQSAVVESEEVVEMPPAAEELPAPGPDLEDLDLDDIEITLELPE